jgi:DNA-binding transcriptional MerR regulator
LRGIKAMQIKDADKIANLPVLGNSLTPLPGTPLPPLVNSALATFMHRNREALQFFAQGAQYEQSRYPIDLTKGSNTLLPHLMGIKRGMQLSEMAAILDAENNDEKQAANDVLMTLALARSLKAEPVLISQLVRSAGVSLAVDALNQVVNRTTLSPESLSGLTKALQSMEDYDARGEGFSRAMAGELAMHLALLNNPAKLVRDLSTASATDVPEGQRHRMIEYLKQARSLKEEQDYLETTSQQLLSARKEAFPERLKVVADLIHQRVTEATDRGLLLNVWLSDGLDKHVNREARCLANLRLALTAVALEQFRAAHNNRYPAGLSELTPNYLDAVLTDPFDGQPLRYRKQDAGYVLYSIGWDLKDDGGKPMNGKGGDIVFTIVTPPAP